MTDIELPRLVGLGGLKRSGKDTLAEHWREKHGYVVMGMSDPLLEMARVLDPLIPIVPARNLLGEMVHAIRLSAIVEKDGYVKAKEHPEVRRFLQALGTDVGRKMIDEDLWVKQAEKTIRAYWAVGKKVALTGIRFPNELALVTRLEGSLLWIHRPGVEEGDTHASETSVRAEDFTWSVGNLSTLERLYEDGDEVLVSMAEDPFPHLPSVEAIAQSIVKRHGAPTVKGEGIIRMADGFAYQPQTAGQPGSRGQQILDLLESRMVSASITTANGTEYIGITQEARALLDKHGYLVAKPAADQVSFYDGTVYTSRTDREYAVLKEMERITAEQDFSWEGRVLSRQQRAEIDRAKKQGREVTITHSSVEVGDFTEAKESEQQRILGLLETIGWTGEIRSDGSVNALHPIDWMVRTDYPEGYTALTKDPHRPLECMQCGARYVNHIQHTKWHAQNDIDDL